MPMFYNSTSFQNFDGIYSLFYWWHSYLDSENKSSGILVDLFLKPLRLIIVEIKTLRDK